MQMRADDIKKFPNFYKHVSTVLPTVQENFSIITVIQELAGNIGEEVIKDSLIWGKGPIIGIVSMLSYGKFKPRKNPNELLIRKKWIKEFEAGNGRYITKWGEPVYLVEVILLHELTHWADYQDGAVKRKKQGEVGDEFETLIYGYQITHRSAEKY